MTDTAVAKPTPAPEAPEPGQKTSWWKSDRAEPVRRNLGLVVVLVLLVIIGIITRPELYSDPTWVKNNIWTILQQASAIGVVTVGMTFVIIGGGIDLSVGAIIALAGVWATTLATQSYGAAGMIFTAVVVGIVVGLINGVLISYGRLVPFIATLAMLLMVAFEETWVCLLEICAARPRAATSMARVAMKGTNRPYEISTPLISPTTMPTTSAVKIMPAAP